jgi:hypothetical protein
MIMKPRFPQKIQFFLVAIIFVFGPVQYLFGVDLPCPVVAEMTLAQKAAEWVTAFQKPYCDYLADYSVSLAKHRSDPGILYQATGISRLFQESPAETEIEGSAAVSRLFGNAKPKNPAISEMASIKLGTLKSGLAITTYSAGKKALTMAGNVDSALTGFAPTAFDFVSSHQAQKDIAKLAYLRGLVQSQELKLASLIKMLEGLENLK